MNKESIPAVYQTRLEQPWMLMLDSTLIVVIVSALFMSRKHRVVGIIKCTRVHHTPTATTGVTSNVIILHTLSSALLIVIMYHFLLYQPVI